MYLNAIYFDSDSIYILADPYFTFIRFNKSKCAVFSSALHLTELVKCFENIYFSNSQTFLCVNCFFALMSYAKIQAKFNGIVKSTRGMA
jgi:hypothetical protein